MPSFSAGALLRSLIPTVALDLQETTAAAARAPCPWRQDGAASKVIVLASVARARRPFLQQEKHKAYCLRGSLGPLHSSLQAEFPTQPCRALGFPASTATTVPLLGFGAQSRRLRGESREAWAPGWKLLFQWGTTGPPHPQVIPLCHTELGMASMKFGNASVLTSLASDWGFQLVCPALNLQGQVLPALSADSGSVSVALHICCSGSPDSTHQEQKIFYQQTDFLSSLSGTV